MSGGCSSGSATCSTGSIGRTDGLTVGRLNQGARETAPFLLQWQNRSRQSVRALPNHIRRNARQDDADVDRERLRLGHEAIAEQGQRARQTNEQDKRKPPRPVRPLEPPPG